MTPFDTIIHLSQFCRQQIRRTARCAPELDVYVSTLLSMDPYMEPEHHLAMIRRSIELALAFHRNHLENSQGEWWFTNAHRLQDERCLAAYQDLVKRIEHEEWALPEHVIRPVIYTISLQGTGEEQRRAFSVACSDAIVCDLRSKHQQSWTADAIRREPIQCYVDLSKERDASTLIIRRAQCLSVHEKIVLLFAEGDTRVSPSLIETLREAGYELFALL